MWGNTVSGSYIISHVWRKTEMSINSLSNVDNVILRATLIYTFETSSERPIKKF
jgi:hypothetical protein